MNTTINTYLGKREDRKLLTGLHTVADLMCSTCDASLGWMYIKAPNGDQQYKECERVLQLVGSASVDLSRQVYP